MRGNCFTYALGMLLAEGFTGRIEPAIVRAGRMPKLRFYYVDAQGVRTYLYPLRPRRGLRACGASLWFAGQVRRA